MADKISQDRIEDLFDEIKMSEAINKQELEPILNESISRYTGRHTPFIGRDWDVILNEVYPVIQNNLPSIFFRNPTAYLKPRTQYFIVKKRNPLTGKLEDTQIESEKSARAQEGILNYSLFEMKYKQEVRKSLIDALLFPYAVMWHGYKGEFGMTEEQAMFIKDEKVFVKRVNPMMFIYDPNVKIAEIEEARWIGRAIDVPIKDILDDDKLNLKEVKKLKGFEGYGQRVGTAKQTREQRGTDVAKTSLLTFASERFRQGQSCRFLRVYEIFLRPTKKEKREGKNGWILLLTEEQKEPLRQNRWSIKAEGFPGKILEFNPLNDSQFGLSDVDTYKQIADQKNAITNLQLRNAQENTKVWVGISKEGVSGEEDIETVVRNGNTIAFFESGNPRDRMFVASPGGSASSELYLIDQRIQRNLEDKSGVTDLKRGFLQSGEESAASVKMRAAGSNARPAYRQDIMSDFLKDSFHYINQLNKQFIKYKDAVRIMGTLDVQWTENLSKEELQADTDVEIDAISMLPENPEMELRELNVTLSLLVQSLTVPEITQKIQQEGKTINLSPIIEKILLRQRINDPNVFRSIKPEESQGFVSVQQMREAQANVEAALKGGQIPHPPSEKDDHRAKLEVYGSIDKLLTEAGQISDTLKQLIMMQSQLLQAIQEKEGQQGQKIKLPKGGVELT